MDKSRFLFVTAGLLTVFVLSNRSAMPQAEKVIFDKQQALERVQEQPPVVEMRKTGVVEVAKNEAGEVTGVTLVVLSYNLVMDDTAKTLAGLEGKRVRVTGEFLGSITNRDERLFKVRDFEPLAENK